MVTEAKTDLEGSLGDETAIHQTNCVTIAHEDGTFAQYMHLIPTIKDGQRVEAGELLGRLGGYTPKYGSHLHVTFYGTDKNKVITFLPEFSSD